MCEKTSTSDIDQEDVEYLKKSLLLLFSESNSCDIKKLGWNGYYSPGPLSPYSFGDKHNLSCNTSMWNADSTNYHSDDSESVYKSIFSPIDYERQYDSRNLFKEIIEKGIDEEDIAFLKRRFDCLLGNPSHRYWTDKVSWDSHPPTLQSSFIDSETNDNCPLNKTGSARSEGYSKVDKLSVLKVKNIDMKLETLQATNNFRKPYSRSYKGNKKTLSREARNDQRRLLTAYESITDSNLLKLNALKFRKKKLRLDKSDIHGLGLFACEPIDSNEIIIEYVGQIIRPIIADIRENEYKKYGIGSYCFRIDEDTIVDATKHGNMNRYINHSCNPNSYAKILNINNKKKIVIYSKKPIKVDEEITYDYKMPIEDDKIVCLCRARGCRKSLN